MYLMLCLIARSLGYKIVVSPLVTENMAYCYPGEVTIYLSTVYDSPMYRVMALAHEVGHAWGLPKVPYHPATYEELIAEERRAWRVARTLVRCMRCTLPKGWAEIEAMCLTGYMAEDFAR